MVSPFIYIYVQYTTKYFFWDLAMDSAARDLLKDIQEETIAHTVHDGYVQEEYPSMSVDPTEQDPMDGPNSETSPEMAIVYAICDMALPRYG